MDHDSQPAIKVSGNHSQLLSRIVLGLAVAMAMAAAAAFLLSYLIAYADVRFYLADFYGTERTARYFNLGVFEAVRGRVRAASIGVAAVAIIIGAGRAFIARLAGPA